MRDDTARIVADVRERLATERARQRLQDLVQHDRETFPGTAGGRALPASPLGRRGRTSSRGGLLPPMSPSPVGAGTPQIHHVTASAVASQDIAAGTSTVQWGDEAGAPNERRGFETFHQQLQASSVGDIPIPLTGVLSGIFDGVWASYRGCRSMTVTLLRDGALIGEPVVYGFGPIHSTHFDGPIDNWNVTKGDHLRIELDNGSGETQTLESLTFVGQIEGTPSGPPLSAFDVPESWDWTVDGTVPANVESGDLLLYVAGEEYVNATLADRTHPGWTEVLFHWDYVYFAGYMGWVGCWSKDVTDEQSGDPVGVSVPGGNSGQLCLRVPGARMLNVATETGTAPETLPSPVTVDMGIGQWGSLILTAALATVSASYGQPDGGTTICAAGGSLGARLAFGYVDTFDGSVDFVWPDPDSRDVQDTVWAAMTLEVAS